jgi:hypothetical protein
MDDETYEVDAVCIRETHLAILVKCDEGGKKPIERWIPKSAIHDDSEVFNAEENREGLLVVKSWFAKKEGWL